MASDPYFDKSRGKWCMKWWAGADRGWVKQTLCAHPKAWTKDNPPKKVPPEVKVLAEKYEAMEVQARHGVSIAKVRGHDLAEHVAQHLRDQAVRSTPETMKVTTRVFGLFVEHAKAKKVRTLEGVSAALCRSYLTSRAEAGVSYATLSTERSLLAPMWAIAAADGVIVANPWRAAKVPGKPKKEAPAYWTKDELARLVAGTRGWLRDLIQVGANTGLRISAMLGLEWRDVDFGRNVVICRAAESKSGRRYEVPMSATANEVLMRRWLLNPEGQELVFAGRRSGKRMFVNFTYDRMRRAVKRLGLPEHGHYNHILRHTFASHAVMSGVPLLVVSSWLGHSSVRMTERYSHLCPSESHRRMEGFDLPAPPPPNP